MQNLVTRVRKACRAQMKFELLQKHSRQVKSILYFLFFFLIFIILFIRHTNLKHFSPLKAQRYAILLLYFLFAKIHNILLKVQFDSISRSLTWALANNYINVFSLKLDPGLEQACQKDLQKFCSNRADVEAVECLKENPTNRKLINSMKNLTSRLVNPTKSSRVDQGT